MEKNQEEETRESTETEALCVRSASRGIDTKNPETEKQQRSATSGSGQSDVIFILLFIDI